MGLAATQQLALERLRDLLAIEAVGVRVVHIDPPEAITSLPALCLFDDGFLPERFGGWQEVQWRLRLQVFVQRGKLAVAIRQCRDIRGNLIDRLDGDITLGGAVSRTTWGEEGLRLAGLEYPPGVEYAGIDGRYTLWLREGKSFQ